MIRGTSPGWKPLTALADDAGGRGRLLGALLTTFDPPDPSSLIEDYFPAWFGLKNSYGEEGEDRLRYFAELESFLRRLKGEITIVSTAGEIATSAEAWIWNYIRRFEVGALAPAVQHAKLWMFHRAPASFGQRETLELVISSTNLTRDGLRGQIQAGWRCVVQLENRASDARRRSWGVLPEFLMEMRKSCGASGDKPMSRWLALLSRCNPPADTTFIASVPGIHTEKSLRREQTAWGIAGIKATWLGRSRPRVTAITPTIGRWTSKSLLAWAQLAGVEVGRISVAWVGERHPWAGRWQLDPSTEVTLSRSGIRWLELARPFSGDWNSPLCDEHQEADLRWSHAKLYELRDGPKTRLLITSANLSQAAWGAPQANGALSIKNFELGVLIKQQQSLSDRLMEGEFARATSEVIRQELAEQPIAWLAASWDGETITLECRPTAETNLAPYVEISIARRKSVSKTAVTWSNEPVCIAKIVWPRCSGVPILLRVLSTTGDARTTAVSDLRPDEDPQILCSEFEEADLREAMEVLREERYGYIPAADDSVDGIPNGTPGGEHAIAAGDYAVPAYVDARRRFSLIDNWWRELSSADDRSRRFILEDGRQIEARWRAAARSITDKGLRLAALVAVDELALRLGKSK
jgi:hypothetical protein